MTGVTPFCTGNTCVAMNGVRSLQGAGAARAKEEQARGDAPTRPSHPERGAWEPERKRAAALSAHAVRTAVVRTFMILSSKRSRIGIRFFL